MRLSYVFAPLLGLLAAAPLHAQTATLRVSSKKTVEVIGLRRWTLQMVQDSLGKYAPGRTLDGHGCAEALRYGVGFADASVSSFSMADDSSEHVVVSVVEPQDSARVRFRQVASDTTSPVRREWRAMAPLLRERPWILGMALQAYPDRLTRGLPAYLARDSAAVREAWRFLDAHRSPADTRLARETLERRDPNVYNRMAAVALLIHSPEHDASWHLLVETMRESDGIQKQFAGTVLTYFARRHPRPVDWSAIAPAIHAMLDGTSLFQTAELIDALLATGVRREWTPHFLAGGGQMLAAYTGSEFDVVREPARRLLVALRGEDPGSDPRLWEEWIRSLGPARVPT